MGKTDTERERHLRGEPPSNSRLAKIFSCLSIAKAAPVDDPDDGAAAELDEAEAEEAELPPQFEQAIAALVAADPSMSEQQAAHQLLHTSYGRALLAHLTKGQQPMDRTTELRKVAAEFGVAKIAKMIVTEGNAHGICEAEFTKMIDDAAQATRQPGESAVAAFTRFYIAPENLELRQAIQVTKSTPVAMPVPSVEPAVQKADASVSDAESVAAYAKLQDLGAELRAQSPELSESQAFAKAFAAHPDLAAKAHVRPSAASGYEFPK
jgi:hypothetical protein